MDHRFDRAAVLSPLEESSAEVSRDSGVASQSGSSLSALSEALSSGTVSHSPSFGPAPGAEEPHTVQEQDDELVRRTAASYSSYICANASEEVVCLEKSLEEMLTRVDEFVGMLDMIRNDTSQIVNISLPQIHQKSEDMRKIYRKVDKLEAFIKMVAANVNAMEEQVIQAEGEVKTLPGAFKKIFRTMTVPGFLNKPASPRRSPQQSQELPPVFRTDDYFTPRPQQ
ncbi:biogenesis of lysosome-related organelles complex 1 subunit 4 [Brachyhypopomus gauderio]|uniref:biogenesis of lysosome-related organelles complex 1 subunit 4 n=1 Tax=Brachyhypopomus gauderio TaxID=698409 RepID=UPI004041F2E1